MMIEESASSGTVAKVFEFYKKLLISMFVAAAAAEQRSA